jgi:hypothetical protein
MNQKRYKKRDTTPNTHTMKQKPKQLLIVVQIEPLLKGKRKKEEKEKRKQGREL